MNYPNLALNNDNAFLPPIGNTDRNYFIEKHENDGNNIIYLDNDLNIE